MHRKLAPLTQKAFADCLPTVSFISGLVFGVQAALMEQHLYSYILFILQYYKYSSL
jgi:hypothetical protein